MTAFEDGALEGKELGGADPDGAGAEGLELAAGSSLAVGAALAAPLLSGASTLGEALAHATAKPPNTMNPSQKPCRHVMATS